VAVGALEPQFFAALLAGLGLDSDDVSLQNDRDAWPRMSETFAAVFRTRSRDDWATHFAGTDACVAPVMSLIEAPHHPHMTDRSTFVEVGGMLQPAPAPRFSATPAATPEAPAMPGFDTVGVLADLGFTESEIGELISTGVVTAPGLTTPV
jgi:alpha-methylacyl-CoA racemase